MPASGKWKVVADVALHEFEENPAGGTIDSNPFGVVAEPGGRLVVDAGANALLSVVQTARSKRWRCSRRYPIRRQLAPP